MELIKRCLYVLLSVCFVLNCKISVTASTADAIEAYSDFIETQSLDEFGEFSFYGGATRSLSEIYKLELADFDCDGEVELHIEGSAASANVSSWILDYQEGTVVCVLSEWAHIIGLYYDDITGTEYLATFEGNGTDVDYEFALCLYDRDWNKTIYAYTYMGRDGYSYNYDENGREVSESYFSDADQRLRDTCTSVNILVTIGYLTPMSLDTAVAELRDYLEENRSDEVIKYKTLLELIEFSRLQG